MSDELTRIARVLGSRYTVEREVGRGGTATVYLATDHKHHRNVAVKVLPPELAAALGPERFLREIRVAAGLTHPHILPLYDSGHGAGLLYYVMPYVRGESLRDRLRREGQLPVEEALRIGAQVADALGHAHAHGVVHRDVKPENVLLADGHALLADFGIAQALQIEGEERLTETGLVVGTAAYMSPEQAAGERDVDARTDVYALGCVLYEMLTGEPPYLGATRQAVLAKRLAEPVPKVRTLRPDVAPDLERTVTKALARSPAGRFSAAEQLGRSLSRSLTIIERQSAARAPQGRARTRLWIGAAAAAVLLTVAIVELLPTAPRLEPRRVLVTVFQDGTGDPRLASLGSVATDYVARGLAETGLVEVVDVRNELTGGGPGASATVGVRDRAKAVGAGSLLRGTYYAHGGALQFDAQVVDVASGEILRALPPVVAPLETPTEAVERLRQRLMAEFAAVFDPRFAPFEAATVPPSYEAYLEVLAANDLFWRGGAPGSPCEDDCPFLALDRLERAAALDPTFTLPRTTAAMMQMLLFKCEDTRRIAADLAGRRLPPSERAQLDVAVAACDANWSGALAAARRAMRHEPRAAGTTEAVPLLALLVNRPGEALRVLDNIDPERGFHTGVTGYYWEKAAAHHFLREHESELRVAREARRRNPDDMAALGIEVVALAALGRVDEVNDRIAERLAAPPEQPRAGSPGRLMRVAGLELRAHGEPEAGRALLERAVAWQRRHPDPSRHGRLMLGRLLYEAGHWDDARAAFEELRAADSLDAGAWRGLGELAARRGDRAGALEADARLSSLGGSREVRAGNIYGRATIAALLGERDRAVSLLRRAFAEGYPFIPRDFTAGPETDPDLDRLRKYGPFEELVKPRG